MLTVLRTAAFQAAPVLLAVSVITFLILYLLPGDPAYNLAGEYATEQDIARIRANLGLDDPLPIQYVRFLGNALQGDFGTSAHTHRSVASEIGTRLRATAILAVTAITIASVIGITLGLVAAVKQGTWIDGSILLVSVLGVSTPIFWIGLMAILLFSVRLHWLPTGGFGSPNHLIMPAAVLALIPLATIARVTRTSMIEVIRNDYVRTARAKGLSDSLVLRRHVIRNGLIPTVTIIGLQFGSLLSGAVLTETVFTWPGIGRLLVDAILWRDYPIIRALLLLFATIFVVINLLTDILYAVIDPRIRVR